MNSGQYVKHSVFHFIKLVLLLVILYGLMRATGYARVSAQSFLAEMYGNPKGLMLLCAMVLWSAFYPMVGFVSRTVTADIFRDREAIIEAFGKDGYALTQEDPAAGMTFRACSVVKRLWLAFADKVTVAAEGDSIVLTGNRKETVQAAFRIETAVRYGRDKG